MFAGLLIGSTANIVSFGPFLPKTTMSEFENPLLISLFSVKFVHSFTRESVLGIERGLCGWFVEIWTLEASF